MYEKLKQQIIFEEGRRLKVYTCTEGHRTIGIGHNLDALPNQNACKIPDEITDEQCDAIFGTDVYSILNDLSVRFPTIEKLDYARRDALINMAFQLGINSFMQFKGMLKAVKFQDWDVAHAHALDSLWAKQTPARAKRVAGQLKSGEYYKAA